jgi:hypothetical protein
MPLLAPVMRIVLPCRREAMLDIVAVGKCWGVKRVGRVVRGCEVRVRRARKVWRLWRVRKGMYFECTMQIEERGSRNMGIGINYQLHGIDDVICSCDLGGQCRSVYLGSNSEMPMRGDCMTHVSTFFGLLFFWAYSSYGGCC